MWEIVNSSSHLKSVPMRFGLIQAFILLDLSVCVGQIMKLVANRQYANNAPTNLLVAGTLSCKICLIHYLFFYIIKAYLNINITKTWRSEVNKGLRANLLENGYQSNRMEFAYAISFDQKFQQFNFPPETVYDQTLNLLWKYIFSKHPLLIKLNILKVKV